MSIKSRRQRVHLVELSDEELSESLKRFESKYGMASDDFYGKWNRGETEDLHDFFQWVALCDMAIRRAADKAPTDMALSSKTTTDHETIRAWVEKRGGRPASTKGMGNGEESAVLRINFPGYAEERLEDISWDEFFRKFDEKDLLFLYQDETSGGEESRFFKFVRRN